MVISPGTPTWLATWFERLGSFRSSRACGFKLRLLSPTLLKTSTSTDRGLGLTSTIGWEVGTCWRATCSQTASVKAATTVRKATGCICCTRCTMHDARCTIHDARLYENLLVRLLFYTLSFCQPDWKLKLNAFPTFRSLEFVGQGAVHY